MTRRVAHPHRLADPLWRNALLQEEVLRRVDGRVVGEGERFVVDWAALGERSPDIDDAQALAGREDALGVIGRVQTDAPLDGRLALIDVDLSGQRESRHENTPG